MKKNINNNPLAFNKSTMVELNDAQLNGVDSGLTWTITTSSKICIGLGALALSLLLD